MPSVFSVAVDALRELGLTSDDVVVRYSSRALLSEVLRELAAGDATIPAILAALDRRSKIPLEAFGPDAGPGPCLMRPGARNFWRFWTA